MRAAVVIALLLASPNLRAEPAALPESFPIVFTFGYGSDDLFPKDEETYEKLIAKVKAAGFTTILGSYEPWKHAICKKHGLDYVVNLLTDEHHVYKNLEGAEALCRKLRGDKTIWGYHLYSDMNSKTAAGRSRDIDNVHKWDPTHPTFVGSYKLGGNSRLANPDVHAYYDFHWQRGPHKNFPHLVQASKIAKDKSCYFYRWMRVSSARPGNPDRIRYTVNTSIACGLKGVFWFLGQEMMDRRAWDWNGYGGDVAKVNLEVVKLGPELMKLGNVEAIYSTPTSVTEKGREKDPKAPPVPPPLTALPDDSWFKVEAGEAVIGHFKDPDGNDALFFANHNAHGPQQMRVAFSRKPKIVALFDRTTGKYAKHSLKKGAVEFEIGNGGGELLKLSR